MKPLAAIEQLGGLQAQLPRPPFVGLWSRIDGFRRDDLLPLIANGKIVRATMMRATLHLASRSDYMKFRRTLQPALSGGLAALRGRTNFDLDALLARAREFFAKPHTMDEFRACVLERDPEADARAEAYAVRLHLPMVQTPSAGKWGYGVGAEFQIFDAALDAERNADFVVRYLGAFGPASVADMQTWSGLRNLREAFESLRPRLVTFTSEAGKELFDLPDAPRPPEDTPASVRFLADYDSVVLAHADRTRIVPDEHRPRMFTKNLTIPSSFLVDGVVAGVWKIERKGAAASLVVTPFGKLPKRVQKELTEEGEKLVRFVEEDAKTFAVKSST